MQSRHTYLMLATHQRVATHRLKNTVLDCRSLSFFAKAVLSGAAFGGGNVGNRTLELFAYILLFLRSSNLLFEKCIEPHGEHSEL